MSHICYWTATHLMFSSGSIHYFLGNWWNCQQKKCPISHCWNKVIKDFRSVPLTRSEAKHNGLFLGPCPICIFCITVMKIKQTIQATTKKTDGRNLNLLGRGNKHFKWNDKKTFSRWSELGFVWTCYHICHRVTTISHLCSFIKTKHRSALQPSNPVR